MKHLTDFIKWAFSCTHNDFVMHLIINKRTSAEIVETIREINANAELVLKNRRKQITDELASINSQLTEPKPDTFKASRISVVDFEVMNEPLRDGLLY